MLLWGSVCHHVKREASRFIHLRSDRRVTWREVARAAYAPGHGLPAGDIPGLDATIVMPLTPARLWEALRSRTRG